MEGRWWQVVTFRQGEIVRSELIDGLEQPGTER